DGEISVVRTDITFPLMSTPMWFEDGSATSGNPAASLSQVSNSTATLGMTPWMPRPEAGLPRLALGAWTTKTRPSPPISDFESASPSVALSLNANAVEKVRGSTVTDAKALPLCERRDGVRRSTRPSAVVTGAHAPPSVRPAVLEKSGKDAPP